MSDQDDIDKKLAAKKAQLELLKKRNAEKAAALKGTAAATTAVTATPAAAAKGGRPTEDAAAVLASVRNTTAPVVAAAAAAVSPAHHDVKAAPKRVVKLTHTSVVSLDIPAVEKHTYEIGSQTDPMSAEQLAGKGAETDADIALRAQFESLQKSEAKLQADVRALHEQNRTLLSKASETEGEVAKARAASERELTAAEIAKLTATDDFHKFFSRSASVALRAVQQNIDFDIMVDYTEDGQPTEAVSKSEEVKAVRKLVFGGPDAAVGNGGVLLPSITGGRPVTSLSFSPKYKELLCVSYAALDDANNLSNEPDGLVLVWSTHMPQRPEYQFTCQSGVLNAQWHPTNPRLILGATASGQIVVWDTREKSAPVNRTSLSDGHTQPVFAFATVPAVNKLHNIVSLSSDGTLCVWSDNDLHAPTTTLQLRHGKDMKEEVASSAFDFPSRETNSIVLASDEGVLYKARIYAQPGIYEEIKGAHDAPITQIQFHPLNKNSPANVTTDLFLTSSYDWTVKLWSNKLSRPLFVFESAKDYVYDVQWSPVHPALFAQGDGAGRLDVWNVSHDTEVPLISVDINKDGSSTNGSGSAGSTGGPAPAAAGGAAGAAGDKKTVAPADAKAGDAKDSKDAKTVPPADGDEKDAPASAAVGSNAISRLRWSDDGTTIAVGTSSGAVLLYVLSQGVSQPTNDDAGLFFNKIHKGRQSSTVSSALAPLQSSALAASAGGGASAGMNLAVNPSLAVSPGASVPSTPSAGGGGGSGLVAVTPGGSVGAQNVGAGTFVPPPMDRSRTGL